MLPFFIQVVVRIKAICESKKENKKPKKKTLLRLISEKPWTRARREKERWIISAALLRLWHADLTNKYSATLNKN